MQHGSRMLYRMRETIAAIFSAPKKKERKKKNANI